MSPITVRPSEPADKPGFLRVWSLTYNNGAPFQEGSSVFKHASPFVATNGSGVVGAFGVMPMTATRGMGLMKSAGVLGVAVLPNVRGSGIGGAMMRWVLRHYREQGFEIASLYAFRESYYRGFGYECCGKHVKLTVDSARLPAFKQELESTVLEVTDIDAITECYAAFSRRHSGMNLRTPSQWERVLNPTSNKTLYAVGNPVEAYALIKQKDGFWEDQWVEEVIWSSLAGYNSIMAVLRGVAINKSKLSWYEPSDSPYLAMYYDHGCKVEIERTPMFRVLNVEAAFSALKPEGSGEFVIEIDDPDIVENRGSWVVQYDASGVFVERTSRAGGVSLHVRHFAQAILGEPSLRDLINLGAARIIDENQALAAQRLLTPSCTYCADFF